MPWLQRISNSIPAWWELNENFLPSPGSQYFTQQKLHMNIKNIITTGSTSGQSTCCFVMTVSLLITSFTVMHNLPARQSKKWSAMCPGFTRMGIKMWYIHPLAIRESGPGLSPAMLITGNRYNNNRPWNRTPTRLPAQRHLLKISAWHVRIAASSCCNCRPKQDRFRNKKLPALHVPNAARWPSWKPAAVTPISSISGKSIRMRKLAFTVTRNNLPVQAWWESKPCIRYQENSSGIPNASACHRSALASGACDTSCVGPMYCSVQTIIHPQTMISFWLRSTSSIHRLLEKTCLSMDSYRNATCYYWRWERWVQ